MSQRGRERDASKERMWRDAVRRWQASGQTIRGFCRDEGLSEAAFHAWRRTIARRDGQASSGMPPEREPTFVPLRLTPTTAPAAPLELVLGSGRIVRVSPGFDAPTLQALLAVLEEQPSC